VGTSYHRSVRPLLYRTLLAADLSVGGLFCDLSQYHNLHKKMMTASVQQRNNCPSARCSSQQADDVQVRHANAEEDPKCRQASMAASSVSVAAEGVPVLSSCLEETTNRVSRAFARAEMVLESDLKDAQQLMMLPPQKMKKRSSATNSGRTISTENTGSSSSRSFDGGKGGYDDVADDDGDSISYCRSIDAEINLLTSFEESIRDELPEVEGSFLAPWEEDRILTSDNDFIDSDVGCVIVDPVAAAKAESSTGCSILSRTRSHTSRGAGELKQQKADLEAGNVTQQTSHNFTSEAKSKLTWRDFLLRTLFGKGWNSDNDDDDRNNYYYFALSTAAIQASTTMTNSGTSGGFLASDLLAGHVFDTYYSGQLRDKMHRQPKHD